MQINKYINMTALYCVKYYYNECLSCCSTESLFWIE